jgi:hypothetical protein
MRQADYPRALNRARINNLMNGFPPYSDAEVEENEIEVNVNELSGPVMAHDARSQFYNGFLNQSSYFTATTDWGARHKRGDYSAWATREVNKIMKPALEYTECFRSKFALNVLHGIGPAGWRNEHLWCPDPLGVEDVMVPANTTLTMRNLPFVAIYHQFTVPELKKLTQGPNRDPGWNMPLVEACIKWADSQTMSLVGSNWPEIWSPEKQEERVKSDGGFYVGDNVPTVDCWDFYYWNDAKKVSGWNRRMILDSWSWPAVDSSLPDSARSPQPSRRTGEPYEGKGLKNEFLYNPGNRKFASKLSEIITWQFADLSAVAPFHYHSVRSLGFLLYAVCHLQNRLYCKFTEAQFEQLMMYFRVKSAEDMQRALKVDLVHRGFIDDNIQFIPANERYQIRADLIQLGLQTNQNIIGRNSASYTSNPTMTPDKRELTATQWMGEANKVSQLVSAALNQAYIYQASEYREIFRRFTRKHSQDPDVRKFQANCLRKGVPEKILYCTDAWEIEPERIMGAGNKTLQMNIVDRLMAARNLFDPEPQRTILKKFALTLTEDPALTDSLVPEQPRVTDTIHDAQLAAGVLMQGMPVTPKAGVNHIEYIETLLASMAMVVQKVSQRGDTATMDEIMGLSNLADHINQHIAMLAQDPNEKQRVKMYGDQLGKLMNLVKRFAQMLQEKQAAGNGGMGQQDQETMAKVQSMKILADAKAANTRESHAQRTAQRQLQFQKQMEQDAQEAQLSMQERQMDLAAEAQKTQIEIQKQSALAALEVKKKRQQAAEGSEE